MAGTTQITDIARTIGVTDVGQIDLTPIEQDPSTGLYVRELRVYEAAVTGSKEGVGRLVFTLRLHSSTRAGIEQVTPEMRF